MRLGGPSSWGGAKTGKVYGGYNDQNRLIIIYEPKLGHISDNYEVVLMMKVGLSI